MTTFKVSTMDGKEQVFHDNADGFLERWREAYVDPERRWPFGFHPAGPRSPEKVVTFNPHTIICVTVEIPAETEPPEGTEPPFGEEPRPPETDESPREETR